MNKLHNMMLEYITFDENDNVSWNLYFEIFTRKLLEFIDSLSLHCADQTQSAKLTDSKSFLIIQSQAQMQLKLRSF